MNDYGNTSIKELLGKAYDVPPTVHSQKKMEQERERIMRELPRGIRSPIITFRLVLIVCIWGMVAFGCIFFYKEVMETLLVVYRCFFSQQPFNEEFVMEHLPYCLLLILGVVETCRFGREVL